MTKDELEEIIREEILDIKVLAFMAWADPNIEIDDLKWDEEGSMVTVAPRRSKDGPPLAHFTKIAREIHGFLGKEDKQTWQELAWFRNPDSPSRPEVTYGTLKYLMPHPEQDPHKYVNSLYFLLSGDEAQFHVAALRQAFNGKIIKDTRQWRNINDGEYLVLSDEEADERAREDILNCLWAFDADFMAGKTDLPREAFSALAQISESANDAVLAIVEKTCGIDNLVRDAILTDGRAHFIMNSYDGEEHEISHSQIVSWLNEMGIENPEDVWIPENTGGENQSWFYIYKIS